MSGLTITIEELTAERLKGRCTEWDDFPRPGYFIEFETTNESCFYAQIESISPVPDDPKTLTLSLVPTLGEPDTRITHVRLLTQWDFFQAQHAADMSGSIPLTLGHVQLDLEQSGSVVYIKPHAKGVHGTILNALQRAGLPILIIDPVGMDLLDFEAKTVRLGEDAKLSLQEVGLNHFIQWVVEGLPTPIQSQATEFLLSLVPPTPDFVPLQYFASHPLLNGHAFSSAILHRFYEFHQHRLFASLPQSALTFKGFEGSLHIDFSALPSELLHIGYEGLLRMISRHTLPRNTQIVLVAPEIEQDFSRIFIQQTTHRVFLISSMDKAWQDTLTDRWEEAKVFGESGLKVNGKVTYGLELFIPYRDCTEDVATSFPAEITFPVERVMPEEDISKTEVFEPAFLEQPEEIAETHHVETIEQSSEPLDFIETSEDEYIEEVPTYFLESLALDNESDTRFLQEDTVGTSQRAGIEPEDQMSDVNVIVPEPMPEKTPEETSDDIEALLLSIASQDIREDSSKAVREKVLEAKQAEESLLEIIEDIVESSYIDVEMSTEDVFDESDPAALCSTGSQDAQEGKEPVLFDLSYFIDREISAEFEADDSGMEDNDSLGERSQGKGVPLDWEDPDDEDVNEPDVAVASQNSEAVNGFQTQTFLAETTAGQLWDMDLSLLDNATAVSSDFNQLLLQDDIPDLLHGIPPIPFLEQVGALTMEWSMAKLDFEENMMAAMAPDLLEGVRGIQFEAKSEPFVFDELKSKMPDSDFQILEPRAQEYPWDEDNEIDLPKPTMISREEAPPDTAASEETHATDSDASSENQDALNYLLGTWMESSSSEDSVSNEEMMESPMQDEEQLGSTMEEQAPLELPTVEAEEEHLLGLSVDAISSAQQETDLSTRLPLEMASQEDMPVQALDEGRLVDFSEPPGESLISLKQDLEAKAEALEMPFSLEPAKVKENALPDDFDFKIFDTTDDEESAQFLDLHLGELVDEEIVPSVFSIDEPVSSESVFSSGFLTQQEEDMAKEENLPFALSFEEQPDNELTSQSNVYQDESIITSKGAELKELSLELDSFTEPLASPSISPALDGSSDPLDMIFTAQNTQLDIGAPNFDLDFQEAEPTQSLALSLDEDIADFSLDLDIHDLMIKPDSTPTEQASQASEGAAALPIYKAKKETIQVAFSPGEQVYHKRYGQGVVKRVIAMDEEHIILNITFEGVGKRLLDPRLTELEKVS